MRLIGEVHIQLIDDGCHNIAVKLGGQHCCGDRLRAEVHYLLRASVPCVPGSGNECAACKAPTRDSVDDPVRGVGPTGWFCQLVDHTSNPLGHSVCSVTRTHEFHAVC